MTQEDGFVEVRTYLENRGPLRWIRPVTVKKVRLLFDVMAMMIVARDSGLDFTELSEIDHEEMMTWMIYGAMQSYASLKNHRLDITVEDVRPMVDGMMKDGKEAIIEAYMKSRELGQLANSYQKARDSLSKERTGEGDEEKKDQGQVSDQMN